MAQFCTKATITKNVIDQVYKWIELYDELKLSKTTLLLDVVLGNPTISRESLASERLTIETGTHPKIVDDQEKVSDAFNTIVNMTGTADEGKIKLLIKLCKLRLKIDFKNSIFRSNLTEGRFPDPESIEKLEMNKKEFMEMIPSIRENFVWCVYNDDLYEFFCIDDTWKFYL
jgi:hypothetical protein